MRVFSILLVGIFLGVAGAFFAYSLSDRNRVVPVAMSDKREAQTTNAFYICTTEFVKDRPLVIKSVDGVAKSITFDWAQDEPVYVIENTDDLHYTAFSRREDGGYRVLNLNRVTGVLEQATHPSNGSRVLLSDMCAQRIPWKECKSRMPSVTGGRESDCPFIVGEFFCPRLNNLGLINEVRQQCIPTERRF